MELAGATVGVNIQNFAFSPASVNVSVGDTVVWTQLDSAPHTSTSDDNPPVWTSGALSLQQTFAFTFYAAGAFSYHCQFHPFMTGSVNVQGAPGMPPVVSINSPSDGATFTAPASFTIQANASAPNGTVAKVEFFTGSTLLGTANVSPYSIPVLELAVGTYVFTAKATDNSGLTATSSPITVMVTATPNQPPQVSLTSPTNSTVVAAPGNLVLVAAASDADGTVTQVEFFAGATSLGVVTTSPYSLSVSNLAAGTYVFSAKATDNAGFATVSSSVTVNVTAPANQPPGVSLLNPTDGTIVAAPGSFNLQAAASDADGSITRVEFFSGTNSLGIATGSPYTLTVSNLSAGSYVLSARATDNAGAVTASSPVHVTVDQPPSVSLTSPANETTLTGPANLTLQAAASDADGSVVKVEFLAGTTLLGTLTAGPYSWPVTNLSAGTFVFSAKATDNAGFATTSSPVTIHVTTPANQPPQVSLISPTNGTIIVAPATLTLVAAASDPDGSVIRVEFISGTNSLGQTTGTPFSLTVSNLAAGTYHLTARATDNGGAAIVSSAVTVTVDAPPIVSLTSPADGTVFSSTTNFTLQAVASDTDGNIARVEFFYDGTLLGTATSSPYVWPVSGLAAGSHVLTAKATDNAGFATTSSPVMVKVTTPANQTPIVNLISPANGTVIPAPGSLNLVATATDPDGNVTKVEFFSGTNVLGVATSVPFSVGVSNLAAGTYSFTARATDNSGVVTISSAVQVTVDRLPIVSILNPTNRTTVVASGTVTLLAVAADVDGSIVKVEYFAGTTSLGTATNSPYSVKLGGLAPGTYTLTAQATDNEGLITTSSPVTLTVTPALPLSLSAPERAANGSFQFTVAGAVPGTTNIIQATGDFIHWTPISTNAVTATPWTFKDPATNFTLRFYRVSGPGSH